MRRLGQHACCPCTGAAVQADTFTLSKAQAVHIVDWCVQSPLPALLPCLCC